MYSISGSGDLHQGIKKAFALIPLAFEVGTTGGESRNNDRANCRAQRLCIFRDAKNLPAGRSHRDNYYRGLVEKKRTKNPMGTVLRPLKELNAILDF